MQHRIICFHRRPAPSLAAQRAASRRGGQGPRSAKPAPLAPLRARPAEITALRAVAAAAVAASGAGPAPVRWICRVLLGRSRGSRRARSQRLLAPAMGSLYSYAPWPGESAAMCGAAVLANGVPRPVRASCRYPSSNPPDCLALGGTGPRDWLQRSGDMLVGTAALTSGKGSGRAVWVAWRADEVACRRDYPVLPRCRGATAVARCTSTVSGNKGAAMRQAPKAPTSRCTGHAPALPGSTAP